MHSLLVFYILSLCTSPTAVLAQVHDEDIGRSHDGCMADPSPPYITPSTVTDGLRAISSLSNQPKPPHSDPYPSHSPDLATHLAKYHVAESKSSVTYSGPAIVGQTSLPASLSTAIFPTNSARPSFPNLGSGRLGQNALSQARTNGRSSLGTFDAPRFPPFVGSSATGSDTSGAPWGNRTAKGTNPYTSAPKTGVVRSYSFVVARGTLAPDGVQRDMVLVNGQFPGPTIEANWGDTIEVTVTNNITGPQEGTAFHWHGLLQVNTNYEDGVPGITQCPIAPGKIFTYKFQADLYGSSWWHSHFSAQYAGGAFGAMIIHGPDNANYDVDLGPVLLTDYYHDDYYSILEKVMGTDLSAIAPFSQNNLINGKGNYNCSLVTDNTTCTENAGLAKFQFVSGKTYRLRLINAGAEAIQRFSIDGHTMQVIAYDFVPIVPYTTYSVTLGVGQRADVLVKAISNAVPAYWMRSAISSTCSLSTQPQALAVIYYSSANTTSEPSSTSWPISDDSCANDALNTTKPYFPLNPPPSTKTAAVSLSFTINSTGNFLWTVNGSSFRSDYNNPILPLLQQNSSTSTFPSEWNVYNFGNSTSFTVVVNNDNPIAHPMHIHGHNMFILAEGDGTFSSSSLSNTTNPNRRDVQLVRPNGHILIQVNADNPGVWPFHCHIAWHVSGGLYMNLLERPQDIRDMVKSPAEVNGLCSSWDEWTSKDVVDQIDSGLKRRKRRHNHFGKHGIDHFRHAL